MILKKKALVLALLTVYLESGTALASSPLTQQLKEQAQFWAQRGKEDNAADAWRKLLQVEPANVDALMALALHEAKTGNPEQAKSYFSKLKGSQASSAQIRSVEDALRRGTAGGSGQLDEARKLARQGDSESAIEAYKQIGDPSRLKGEAAFEYLQTLAGTKNGYPDAKRGLEKLSKDNPSNTRYALAYAQVLTYREPSRLEGIAALENLSSKADVGKQAADSWRQALSWMGLKNENAKHFRRYLDKFPDDQVISERLASLNRPAAPSALEEKTGPVKVIATAKQNVAVKPPAEVKQKAEAAPKKDNTAKAESSAKVSAGNLDKARTAAFKSLDDNDVKTAEAGFQALIKSHPKDSAGYGGMGLVKMREEEFIEARGFLEKAVEYSPAQSKDQWKKAFEDASYWAIVAEARTAFEDGDSVKGIAFLRKAIALNGTEPAGILQLADALQAENDLKGAEENYRHVLNADKTNLRALDGVIGVLVLQKRLADLEALSSIMLPRHLAIVANLKSEELWNKAKAAEAAGDLNTAQSTLEDAILIKPDNAWLRMALSKIYLKRDMPGQARALIEAMTNVENPDPEALYVSALLSEMQQQWWDAMITLERIPPASRKKEMAEMQRRLWIRVQLDRIELLRKRGNLVAAKNILTTVESVTANDPEFTSAMANLYIQLGDTERGYAMIRQAVQNTPKPSAGLLLQYAGTLMQPNQEGELEAVMLRVAAMPKLEEAEITAFQQLQRILSIRYAERAREAGDYATAYNYIQPLLIANPDDSMLLLALARLYSTSGDKESARELYGKVLETEPENPEVLQGLVYAAIEAKDFENAERHLDLLMRLQPDNPRYIALAGNVARAQGNNSRALSYFKQALAMEQSQRPSALMGPNGIRLVAQGQAPNINDFRVNPFSDRNQASAGGSNGVALRNAPVQQQASVPNSKSAIFAPVGIPLQQPAQNARSAQGQYSIPQLPASITQNNQVNSAGTAVQARPQPSVPQLPASVTAPAPISAPAPASMAVSNGAPAILQGGSSGTPGGTTVGAATIYQIPPAVVTRSPLTQSPVGNSNVYSGGAPASAASPSSYVAPKASYSNSYAAPAPVPQQYAAATVNSGTSSKARTARPATNVSAEEAGLLKEIDAINDLNRTEISVEVATRARSGEKGLSALKDIETPIEAQITTLGLGQFGLKIIPVLADAGTLYLNDPSLAGQYGRNAILVERAKYAKVPLTTIARQQGLSSVATLDQEAKGVALNLSYELAGVRADIGSSPIGFPVQNIVGGLRWSGSDDGASLGIEIARKSVTDSYLSYAGAKDSLYGLTWGGVTRTGIKLDTSYDGEDGGVYASGGYYGLTGKNVAKNTMAEFGAGAYWRAYKTNDFTFTTGLGLTTFFYNKNLRYFTYGHGGYFSPKSYVAMGIPLDFAGRKGKLSYQIGTSLGVQHFRELDAPYYPNSPADQAELEQFAAANPTINIPTSYPGQTRTAFAFKLTGAAEYQLTPHLFLGGRLSADNSGDFNDAAAAVYLRYSFETRKGPVAFPPLAPKPYYLGN